MQAQVLIFLEICHFWAQWYQSNHLIFIGIKINTRGFSNVGYLRWNNQQFFAQVHLLNDKKKVWYA